MLRSSVPDIVVGRLPTYLRVLTQLMAEGRQITSSQELGDRLGISSAQIRKDLSHFGEFGKQGTGYSVPFLREQLRAILNVDRAWNVVLVGAGDLGHALANYDGFSASGFHVVGVFDSDDNKIGMALGRHVIRPMEDIEPVIKQHQAEMAIIAVPAEAAREVCNRLVEAGIKAILTYAPMTLSVPPDVRVQYIDPVGRLQHMAYYQNEAPL